MDRVLLCKGAGEPNSQTGKKMAIKVGLQAAKGDSRRISKVPEYRISRSKLTRITKRAEQIRQHLNDAQPRERPLSAVRFRSVVYR